MPCFFVCRAADAALRGYVGDAFGEGRPVRSPTLLTCGEEKPKQQAAPAERGKLTDSTSGTAADQTGGRRPPGWRSPSPTLLTSRPIRGLGTIKEETPEQLKMGAAGKVEPVDIAQGAAKGRRCMRPPDRTGARAEAEYLVVADLGQLVLTTTAGAAGRRRIVVSRVLSIADVYPVDGGAACIPEHIRGLLSSEEAAGLCLIVHADSPNAGPVKVYLVDVSQSARDSLHQHLSRCLKH